MILAMAKAKQVHQEAEQHHDAWERFERAVDVVAKSPPQHRIKKKPPKRRASSSKPKSASRRV
jgi:hypothetical protein